MLQILHKTSSLFSSIPWLHSQRIPLLSYIKLHYFELYIKISQKETMHWNTAAVHMQNNKSFTKSHQYWGNSSWLVDFACVPADSKSMVMQLYCTVYHLKSNFLSICRKASDLIDYTAFCLNFTCTDQWLPYYTCNTWANKLSLL